MLLTPLTVLKHQSTLNKIKFKLKKLFKQSIATSGHVVKSVLYALVRIHTDYFQQYSL